MSAVMSPECFTELLALVTAVYCEFRVWYVVQTPHTVLGNVPLCHLGAMGSPQTYVCPKMVKTPNVIFFNLM